MPLPADVALLKVYPALGIARTSTSADYYVFDEAQPQAGYKTAGGVMKRQAVQFRLFMHRADGSVIGELTAAQQAAFGVSVVWTATVANLKIADLRQDQSYAILAEARSDAHNGELFGKCGDFQEGQRIPLGKILPSGVFEPPPAAIFRRRAGQPLPDHGMFLDEVADNVCDGTIGAIVQEANTAVVAVRVLPGWVVVAPQDFAPDWNDDGTGPSLTANEDLETAIVRSLGRGVPLNGAPNNLTRAHLRTATARFGPGVEVGRAAIEPTAYHLDPLDPADIRPTRGDAGGGVSPGHLTRDLCSPWQFDFMACTCSWWPNHRPDVAFRDGQEVNWLRRKATETGRAPPSGVISTAPELLQVVDELGVVRKDATGKAVEKERTRDF